MLAGATFVFVVAFAVTSPDQARVPAPTILNPSAPTSAPVTLQLPAEKYFAKLVRIAGASDFIRCHDFGTLQQRSALDPSGSIEQLRSEAEQRWQLKRGTADWRLRLLTATKETT